jgi:hypothetical protein
MCWTQRHTSNAKKVHPLNTRPMLAGARYGARTRSGQPCRSSAVTGKRRCRMHGGAAWRQPSTAGWRRPARCSRPSSCCHGISRKRRLRKSTWPSSSTNGWKSPCGRPALYQHLLLTAERKFWRWVESGESPHLFGIEPPRPRLEAVRSVGMSGSNAWTEFANLYRVTRAAAMEHDRAKAELKALSPIQMCQRQGVRMFPKSRAPMPI